MVYNGFSAWTAACFNQMTVFLSCSVGNISLSVNAYVASDCSTGTYQTCVSGIGLILTSYDCSPLSLVYTVNNAHCTVLWSTGYTSFTIT